MNNLQAFQDLEKAALPAPWATAMYSKKKCGIGTSGDGAEFFYAAHPDSNWEPSDGNNVSLIRNLRNYAARLLNLWEVVETSGVAKTCQPIADALEALNKQ